MPRTCRESFKTFPASFLDHSCIRDTLLLWTQLFQVPLAFLTTQLKLSRCHQISQDIFQPSSPSSPSLELQVWPKARTWPWWTSHSWPHQPRDRGLLVICRAELNFLLCPRQAWNNPGICQLLQAGMFYFIGTDWKDPANLMMSQKKDSLWTVLLQLIRRGVLSLIIPDDGKKINLMFCTKDVKGNDSIRNKTAGGEKPPYERFFDMKWIKRIKDLRTEDGTITQPPPQMLDFPLRFFK